VLDSIPFDSAIRLAIALGIGLLIGAERERRMAERGRRGTAGVRTFALVGLLGGIVAQTDQPALIAVGLVFVGAAILVGYFREPDELGITSEVALVVTYGLGVLAQEQPALASAVAVVVTILLATRSQMHRFVSSVLTEQELQDALVLAACAVVVLPLLPDRPVGPGGALNPFSVWRLVVLLMAVSSAGYIAVRAVGPRFGLPIAGLLGGFVSSTATIGAMASRVREQPALARAAMSGALASTIATFAQMAVVVFAIHAPTLRQLAWPLFLGGVTALVLAGIAMIGTGRTEHNQRIEYGRAFNLRTALLLAAAISAVTVVSAVAADLAGGRGLLVATALGGFADAHASAVGAASVASAGSIAPPTVALVILAAISSNTISKIAAAWVGGPRFALFVGVGLVIVLAAAWTATWLPAP
jgi:uncharacterized membrane protein (DUF4010 family)